MSSSGATGGTVKVGLLSGKQAEIPFAPADTLRALGPEILSRLGLKPMVAFHPTPVRFLRGTEELQPEQLVTALDLQPGEEITIFARTKKEMYDMTFDIGLKFTSCDLRARLTLSDAYSFSIELIGGEDGEENCDREIHGTWSIELKDQDPQREALVLRPFGTPVGAPFSCRENIANAAFALSNALGREPVGLPASWFRDPGHLHWDGGAKDGGDALVSLLDPDATMRTLRQEIEEEYKVRLGTAAIQ